MLVAALSKKGSEFCYIPSSARKVSHASGQKICDIANSVKYMLDKYPGYVWYLHDVDKYDLSFDFAQYQHFSIRNGLVKDHR